MKSFEELKNEIKDLDKIKKHYQGIGAKLKVNLDKLNEHIVYPIAGTFGCPVCDTIMDTGYNVYFCKEKDYEFMLLAKQNPEVIKSIVIQDFMKDSGDSISISDGNGNYYQLTIRKTNGN